MQNKIIKWLKKQVLSANAKGLVVGLSGGIDSAVVSVLAKKAFPGNSLCVIMPCNSSAEDVEYASLLIKKFKIKSRMVDLSGIFNAYIKKLPKAKSALAYGNIKARLRMITLYYFANINNYLVAGTGNKSELTMGYFTKYGDGGVDILPLGNLVKREVVKLAKELKIPDEIIKRPPSAGLWKGQTDESEMGITYKELDSIIKGKTRGISPSKIKKVKKTFTSTEHKRRLAAIYK